MITPDELGKQIYEKQEYLRLIRQRLRDAKRELLEISPTARLQEYRRKYWTKEQRRELALWETIEGLELLEERLMKNINICYKDLREMEN